MDGKWKLILKTNTQFNPMKERNHISLERIIPAPALLFKARQGTKQIVLEKKAKKKE